MLLDVSPLPLQKDYQFARGKQSFHRTYHTITDSEAINPGLTAPTLAPSAAALFRPGLPMFLFPSGIIGRTASFCCIVLAKLSNLTPQPIQV
jgi:hypothetical protein